MTTIRNEREVTCMGVQARAFAVIAAESGRILNQTIKARRELPGDRASLTVTLRFDDECRNGHESFAITAEERERGRVEACGCLHERIAEVFPEFAPLIKWHLCSTDGPLHYIANTLFAAGDRDPFGRPAGAPASFQDCVTFGENPIKHVLKRTFAKFLEDVGTQCRFDFEVIAVPHARDFKTFGNKYTFGGYACEWHECPFDSESEALDFLRALQHCGPEFGRVAISFSTGKKRELDHARHAAIWPEATDDELMQEPNALREVLTARLPALLAEFRAAMVGAGFLWPEAPRA